MLKRLGMGLLLGAALAGGAWAQGSPRFDGQYVGELTLTGIISGDCTKPPLGSAYPLTISGGVVRFKYVPRFDTVLIGRIDDSGSFKATRRLKSGTVEMTGHIDGSNVTAHIVSPSCEYAFRTQN
jgi:hypothetical protein